MYVYINTLTHFYTLTHKHKKSVVYIVAIKQWQVWMWQYISKCNWKTYFQMEKLFHFPNTVVHVSSPQKDGNHWEGHLSPDSNAVGSNATPGSFSLFPSTTPPHPAPQAISPPPNNQPSKTTLCPSVGGGGEDWAMGLSEHNSQPLTVTTTMQGIYLLTLYASVFYNLCFSLYQTLDPGWIWSVISSISRNFLFLDIDWCARCFCVYNVLLYVFFCVQCYTYNTNSWMSVTETMMQRNVFHCILLCFPSVFCCISCQVFCSWYCVLQCQVYHRILKSIEAGSSVYKGNHLSGCSALQNNQSVSF